jgi:hypothetical protein
VIGKSYFLSYLLVLRLLNGLPTIFLTPLSNLHIFVGGQCFQYMSGAVKGGFLDLQSLWDKYPDAQWWVLVDTPVLPATLAQQVQDPGWTFVHAASPGSLKQAKTWSKNISSFVYYLDVWTNEEMFFVG